jgi:tRNA(fMet)-specific endonuclease VapC
VNGWLAFLNRSRTEKRIVEGYAELENIQRYFCDMRILSFSHNAQDRFNDLRGRGIRIGTMDLRIACIALEADSTLLSRNLRDFRQVPGLVVEDWTT